jgi:hypothetical protein
MFIAGREVLGVGVECVVGAPVVRPAAVLLRVHVCVLVSHGHVPVVVVVRYREEVRLRVVALVGHWLLAVVIVLGLGVLDELIPLRLPLLIAVVVAAA